MTARSLAAKAHRAVRRATQAQRHPPLPEGLRHLFQPYTPGSVYQQRRQEERTLMHRIVDAQDRICPYCDDWLEFDPEFDISHPLKPSIDHVVPRSRGGGNVGNRIVMHRECNCAKGNRLPTGCERIWLAAVNARIGL